VFQKQKISTKKNLSFVNIHNVCNMSLTTDPFDSHFQRIACLKDVKYSVVNSFYNWKLILVKSFKAYLGESQCHLYQADWRLNHPSGQKQAIFQNKFFHE